MTDKSNHRYKLKKSKSIKISHTIDITKKKNTSITDAFQIRLAIESYASNQQINAASRKYFKTVSIFLYRPNGTLYSNYISDKVSADTYRIPHNFPSNSRQNLQRTLHTK